MLEVEVQRGGLGSRRKVEVLGSRGRVEVLRSRGRVEIVG